MPYGQRGMGWPIWAHVRGRRRRRHLRHRRRLFQWHRQLLLRGRLGEHRRRCAAGLCRWGSVGGVIKGVLSGVQRGGTRGVLKEYPGGLARISARFSDHRPCRSPSVAAHKRSRRCHYMYGVWRACLSARTVCVLIRARPRVCSCVCVRVRVCACLLVRLCARACTACVNELCARAPCGCMRPPIARRRRAVLIARHPPHVGGRARGCVRCHRPGSRASAAGVTWNCRTAKAEWTARAWHTSVVDAAGAIYVICGRNGYVFQDVWASTDGGARPD